MLFVVSLVLHFKLPVQPLALKVAFSPSQHTVLFALITGAAGLLPVVIVITVLLALSPHSVIHFAEYVPAPTTIVLLVAFVLHFTVPAQPMAVKVAVSALHKLVLSALIVGTAGGTPVVIVTGFELLDIPQTVVQVAVYVPAPTSFVRPVPPFDHVTMPSQPLAVKVAFSFPQIVVLLATIVGGFGTAPVVIVTLFDAGLTPHTFSQVAEYVPAPT
jgi:hypothetical protein